MNVSLILADIEKRVLIQIPHIKTEVKKDTLKDLGSSRHNHKDFYEYRSKFWNEIVQEIVRLKGVPAGQSATAREAGPYKTFLDIISLLIIHEITYLQESGHPDKDILNYYSDILTHHTHGAHTLDVSLCILRVLDLLGRDIKDMTKIVDRELAERGSHTARPYYYQYLLYDNEKNTLYPSHYLHGSLDSIIKDVCGAKDRNTAEKEGIGVIIINRKDMGKTVIINKSDTTDRYLKALNEQDYKTVNDIITIYGIINAFDIGLKNNYIKEIPRKDMGSDVNILYISSGKKDKWIIVLYIDTDYYIALRNADGVFLHEEIPSSIQLMLLHQNDGRLRKEHVLWSENTVLDRDMFLIKNKEEEKKAFDNKILKYFGTYTEKLDYTRQDFATKSIEEINGLIKSEMSKKGGTGKDYLSLEIALSKYISRQEKEEDEDGARSGTDEEGTDEETDEEETDEEEIEDQKIEEEKRIKREIYKIYGNEMYKMMM